jgi:hypothetical protein
MSRNSESGFENFLQQQDETAWAQARESLLAEVHEVDRNATSIWFAFFPLSLARAFEQADDPEALAQKLLMMGRYRLRDQIDSSHTFFYGHRFWPEVKQAVAGHAAGFNASSQATLAEQIREVARAVAAQKKIDASLLTGITAVAFMTLQQVGLAAFESAPGRSNLTREARGKRRRRFCASARKTTVRACSVSCARRINVGRSSGTSATDGALQDDPPSGDRFRCRDG